ncbi:TetR/AcrR family transcriptional regulator [Nonomuraea sp. K274]|uniref:TetR/AcrR family transcriptional regulator n=1 Tax=Nonomuraea cypriaca TaxID=1187855 RepID=A0A931ANQ1_9ACTN|nr:TetR/AcrR family transcriptional regulator [Nonomuraea cypriaca]MBF8193953.1 TetR/AcrR family transcriptional regulator [Nonomuraea cypriaca]
MARPRTFEEGRAVESAMRAFWEAGYEGTSTQDLCAATGLGRSSIYNTFASKHDLFEKALRHYMDSRIATLTELMDAGLPVKEKVRTVLRWAVEPEPGEPPGCLVVNSLIELGPHDPEIAALLERHNADQRRLVRSALEIAISRGEIDRDKDPLALAYFVFATVSGMRVAACGGADRAALEAIANTALSVF